MYYLNTCFLTTMHVVECEIEILDPTGKGGGGRKREKDNDEG